MQFQSAFCNGLTQPLCSSRITSLHRSNELVRPTTMHRYSRLVVSSTCASPLPSWWLVPPVPHESPNQIRASSTPTAAHFGNQVSNELIAEDGHTSGFDSIFVLTTSQQRFRVIRLSDSYLPEVYPGLNLQRTLPTAFDRSSLEWFGACS